MWCENKCTENETIVIHFQSNATIFFPIRTMLMVTDTGEHVAKCIYTGKRICVSRDEHELHDVTVSILTNVI